MKPIDLYRLVMGDRVWTLTSADENQEYDAGSGLELYVATAMGRGEVMQKNEISKADLDISLPLDHDLAVELLASFSEQILSVTVFTDFDGVVQVTWKGRLSAVVPGNAEVTLRCESIFTSLRRPGLRARFQKSCRHALYHARGCTLDPEDFDQPATLDDIDGRVLTIPEADLLADGWLTGGMVRAPDEGLLFITNHVGAEVTVQRVSYSLAQAFAASGPGLSITIYPGCDHTRATCESKFNNLLNYGGFDWIPSKNPMGGNSIV